MRDFLMHTYDLLVKGSAAIVGFFHGMYRENRPSAVLLLCLMAADYLTGFIAAWLNKKQQQAGKWSGAAAFRRLLPKTAMLLVLILSAVLDWFINDHNAMFFTAVCWMYIGSEALSLLENLTLCGVPVPAVLKRRLKWFGAGEQPSSHQPSPAPAQNISSGR